MGRNSLLRVVSKAKTCHKLCVRERALGDLYVGRNIGPIFCFSMKTCLFNICNSADNMLLSEALQITLCNVYCQFSPAIKSMK